jgi:hypothetical protein
MFSGPNTDETMLGGMDLNEGRTDVGALPCCFFDTKEFEDPRFCPDKDIHPDDYLERRDRTTVG